MLLHKKSGWGGERPAYACIDEAGRGVKLKQQREQVSKLPVDNNFWNTGQVKQSTEGQNPGYTRKEDAETFWESPLAMLCNEDIVCQWLSTS